MKSSIAILLIAAGATSARTLRSTDHPEITPFPGNANSKMFCNYACSSKFYGGEMGWGEVSPIKYEYPVLDNYVNNSMKLFYNTQKDPVIKACGRPKKDNFQLYNACADVGYGEDDSANIGEYILQFGIVVPCDKKTINKLQSSGVDYPIVNGDFIVPVRAAISRYQNPDNKPTFAVANPDFAPSSNPYKPEGGVPGFPKVQQSEVCDNCTGPTAKQCQKKKTLEEVICQDVPQGKYLESNDKEISPHCV